MVGGASRWLPGTKGKGKGRGGGGAEALGAAQVLHELGVQLVVARSGPSQDSGRRLRPRRPVPGPPGQPRKQGEGGAPLPRSGPAPPPGPPIFGEMGRKRRGNGGRPRGKSARLADLSAGMEGGAA